MEPVTITCPHCAKDFETDKLEKVDCSGCENTFLSIETKKCKECGNIYCLDCADDNFTGEFCLECNEIECSGCEYALEREDTKKCPKCGNYFCSDCEYFDNEGLCMDCTQQRTARCADCNQRRLEADDQRCLNCKRYFCSECEDFISCSNCNKSVCGDCGERCSECNKPYCIDCMQFKNGRCSIHGSRSSVYELKENFFRWLGL